MNFGLWRRQIAAVLGLEIKKNFLARRGLWIYLVAIAPALICGMHSLQMLHRGRACNFPGDNMIFAGIFQFFILRLAIFFACAGIFMNLIRGEILDKSLHYYFLSPVRREVLLIGKYLSGLLTAATVFTASVLLTLWALYLHFSSEVVSNYIWNGPGLRIILTYVGVTWLACIGYGAVFLMMGVLFRNPMIPAGAVAVWEGMNPFLPAALQKISVLFYLKSLCPFQAPVKGPLAILAVITNPSPPWLAASGLLLLATVVLILACRRIRMTEISYAAD